MVEEFPKELGLRWEKCDKQIYSANNTYVGTTSRSGINEA
jgi:hypothetical protein